MPSLRFPRTAVRRALVLGAVTATLLPLAACGGGSGTPKVTEVVPGTSDPAKTIPTTVPGAPTVSSQVMDAPPEIVAQAQAQRQLLTDYQPAPAGTSIVLQATVPEVAIYDTMTSRTPKLTMKSPIESGAPLTFLVDGFTTTRYKVLLPVKPNGSTGWVDPMQVKKLIHDYKLVVELSAHRITAYKGKTVILSDKIATGKDDTPTPNGRYYIKELLKPCYDRKQPNGTSTCVVDPKGPYGPYAYGLSGFSPVVQHFNGGDDVLGIHGTDQEQLLGGDVSHGCIRMANASIATLAKILPLGTPVVVKP